MAKASRSARQAQASNRQQLIILAALAIAVVAVMALVIALTPSPNAPANNAAQADPALLVREDSITRGPADARVTLVEFLDFECEACRAAYPMVEEILAEYEGRIRYVVRYFSNHNNSVLAVAAAEAAGEQGRYWDMVGALFANQPQWGELATPQTETFISYAAQLGLDVDQFTASLQNPAYQQKAARDQADTQALGLRGTPTFFVNGQLVYGIDEAGLRRLIEQGLAG